MSNNYRSTILHIFFEISRSWVVNILSTFVQKKKKKKPNKQKQKQNKTQKSPQWYIPYSSLPYSTLSNESGQVQMYLQMIFRKLIFFISLKC